MAEDGKLGNYDETFDKILARSIELDRQKYPDISNLKHCVLHQGHRTYKVAKCWTIINRNTGEYHHDVLTLETYDQSKSQGWRRKPDKSISLMNEDVDQIQILFDFLANVSHVQGSANYTIIRHDSDRINQIIEAISATDERRELIDQILTWVADEPTATDGLIQLSIDNPVRSKSLVAALNYGRYKRALDEFKNLIDENRQESEYQRFLQENYWIFGSEYSELLPYRSISNGIAVDFPLRRTLDGYLEVIEIKRPLADALFVGGRHLYPRSEVTEAISQANEYLQIIERDNYRIQGEFHILVDKVRAKVIIGRDGDENQQKALRLWNSNQKQVEVVTFDQLTRIGERILDILAEENSQIVQTSIDLSDIPF